MVGGQSVKPLAMLLRVETAVCTAVPRLLGGSGNSGGKVPDLVDTISFLAGVSVSGLETVGNGDF